ncbi:MAG: tRNA lysidine(34) synthetase TilS, partial [Phototrophicaceae bacterium]
GDRFQPPGLGGRSQKLSDWMIDHKLPRELRDRIPLLVIDERVAAIGWGGRWLVGEPFLPGPDFGRVACLTVIESTI